MEKKPGIGRLILRATFITYCLLLLALLYANFYGSDIVLFYQTSSRGVGFDADEHKLGLNEATQIQEEEIMKTEDSGISSLLINETTRKGRESGQLLIQDREISAGRLNKEMIEFEFEVQDSNSMAESTGNRVVSEEILPEQSNTNQLKVFNNETAAVVVVGELEEKSDEVNDSGQQISPVTAGEDSGTTIKEDNSLFTRLVRGEDRTKLESTGFSCHTAPQSVVCVARKPVTIDTATMTMYIPAEVKPNHTVIRPYARQDDEDVMKNIRPVNFFLGNTTPAPPACEHNHDVPAVIFSSSGFTGNLFHEFNEIIIPLFLMTNHFQTRVQFILMDYKQTFVNKYKRVISRLSSYQIMNPVSNPGVHCFTGAVAGLKWHDHLTVNPNEIPGNYTMDNFRDFIRKAYGLKTINVSEIKTPKLLLLSRRGTRRFVNEAQMIAMMKDLGFQVVVAWKPNRMSNLNKFSRVVNSCSVLLGSHGAGLANELFLPDGGVMVQIDALGLEWGSAHFYGNPAEAMKLHYLRYKIDPEESTLYDIYGKNHTVITDPDSIYAHGYQAGRAVYLDQQNMKLNLVRLRETLVEALRLTGFSVPQKKQQ